MKNEQLSNLAKEVLTAGELKLFELMNTQYLVPFIKGFPGIGKTATLETIANKLGMVYIDLRLPAVDDVDMGLYPVVNQKVINGITINKLEHAAPEWAVMPIDNPDKNYLIVFEELNRANPSVRNAAMGVVLERRVGWNIKFGTNVFMAATGNLGDRDGTEVEELDFAQRDRFIIMEQKHNLGDWIEDYAKNRIHPEIIRYLENNPAEFYPDFKEQEDDVVLTPRKWTGFSDFLVANTDNGLKSKIDEIIPLIDRSGMHFVGKRFERFRKFILEGRMLTAKDVIDGSYISKNKNYDRIARENKSEVLHELKSISVETLTKKQASNVLSFMKHVREHDHDVLTGFVYDISHLVYTKYSLTDEELKDTTKRQQLRDSLLAIPFVKGLYADFKEELKMIGDKVAKAA